MIRVNDLKAEFTRNGYTQEEIAKKLGITPNTLRRRLTTGVFGSDEISKLIDILNIENPMSIFFAE